MDRCHACPLTHANYKSHLEKSASISSRLHPAVQRFVRAIRPTPKGIYILVNALGAGEVLGIQH